MYCRNCYTKLQSTDNGICPRCGQRFNLAKPGTYLTRPFPRSSRIIVQVVLTTFVGLLAAFVVAFFQMVGASGH